MTSPALDSPGITGTSTVTGTGTAMTGPTATATTTTTRTGGAVTGPTATGTGTTTGTGAAVTGPAATATTGSGDTTQGLASGPARRPPAGGPVPPRAAPVLPGRDLLDLAGADPHAPLRACVVAPGGYGKTTLLRELERGYAAAGIRVESGWPTGTPGPDSADAETDTVTLVDDAHLLDDRRLRELHRLATDGGARMVVAYRPWPRPPALGDLVEALCRHRPPLVLPPLSPAQVATCLATVLDRAPAPVPAPAPASLAGFVAAQTRGVPRYVFRLARALAEQDGAAGTPPGALAPFAAEFDALDPDVRLVLLAVEAGCGLHLDLVGGLVGRDAEGVAELMTAARACGLLWPDGTLVPLVRNAIAALEPLAHRVRVRQRLAALQLARGGPVLPLVAPLLGIGRESGRFFVGAAASATGAGPTGAGATTVGTTTTGTTAVWATGTGATTAGTTAAGPVVKVGGAGIAAAFDAAGREALADDPALAARLFSAATAGGRPAAARQALATALAGDLETAARLADQVVSAGDGPQRADAAYVAAVALAHRGQLARGVELFGWAPPGPAAGFAVVGLIGTGRLDEARRYAHPRRPDTATAPAGPPTLAASAASLMARGVYESVTGSPAAALSVLVQAATLLEPAGRAVLLPDSPAALAALVGLHCAEFDTAEIMLDRAVEAATGGPLLRDRHRLLRAWLSMTRGRMAAAGALAPEPGVLGRLPVRDRLFAAALRVGLARRNSDLGALREAWPDACQALVGHPVDLYTLLPLGELAIGAARLGDERRLAGHLAEAEALLARIGEPALWSVPLHWCHLHAAIIAERADEAERHAAALAGLSGHSPYAGVVAGAAQSWLAVLAGRVDIAAVEEAARGLAGVGLAWDGARLAGQAAIRTADRAAMTALLDCARLLQGRRTRGAAGRGSTAGSGSAGPGGAGGTGGHGTGGGHGFDGHGAAGAQGTGGGHGAAGAHGFGGHGADGHGFGRHGVGGYGDIPTGYGATGVPRQGSGPRRTGSGASARADETLSERELQVAELVLAGLTYKQVGDRLYISAKTVEHHMARMRQRLGCADRRDLLTRLRAITIECGGATPRSGDAAGSEA